MTASGALVCNYGGSTVSLVNSAASVTANITVGTNPIQAAQASSTASLVYVTNYSSSNVSAVSLAGASVAATITVGANPYGVVLSPDGSKAYVACAGAAAIYVISTATNSVAASVSLAGDPGFVALSPDGGTLWAWMFTGSQTGLAIVNTSSLAVSYGPAQGAGPVYSSRLAYGGGYLWVNNEAGTIYAYSGASVAASVSSLGNPTDDIVLGPAGSALYVATPASVAVINTGASVSLGTTISLGAGATPAALAVSGQTLLVVGGTKAYLCSTLTNTTGTTFTVGSNAKAVAISLDGTTAFVANYGSGNVSVINLTNAGLTGTVSTGTDPSFVLPVTTSPISPPVTGVPWLRMFQRSMLLRMFQAGL